MGQGKCLKFLPLATMHTSHLQCMEIHTFWNSPGISQISLAATVILDTSSSALSTEVHKPVSSFDPKNKT